MRTLLSICTASLIVISLTACQRAHEPSSLPAQEVERLGSAKISFITPGISDGCASIQFDGEIEPGDRGRLAKLISLNEQGCSNEQIEPGVSFNSPGGDLDEAVAIGKLVREKGIATIVMPGASCISACAVAFLGGVSRTVNGVYGIHRPYTIDPSAGPRDSLDQYNSMIRMLNSYMLEMRISPDLAEQMVKTSPENVRFLTPSEMSSLGVTGKDPVWEDILITKNARKYGISRQEYISRRAATANLCGKGLRPHPDPCVESVMRTGRSNLQ